MRVTFLGTGDAGGVPRYGCDCAACARARAVVDFRRGPCSALVEAGDTRVLIDAGQMDLTERFPPGSLSAIFLTHFHPDHVQGLFHLRWGLGNAIPVYAPPDSEGCADLYRNHGLLEFRRLAKFEPVVVGDLTLTPLPLIHSKVTFGFAAEARHGPRFAYLTDTAGLPPRTEEFLTQWSADGLALDCSHPPQVDPQTEQKNHNDWNQALGIVERLKANQAWLMHISHALDAWLLDADPILVPGVHIARDRLVVEFAAHETEAAAS